MLYFMTVYILIYYSDMLHKGTQDMHKVFELAFAVAVAAWTFAAVGNNYK